MLSSIFEREKKTKVVFLLSTQRSIKALKETPSLTWKCASFFSPFFLFVIIHSIALIFSNTGTAAFIWPTPSVLLLLLFKEPCVIAWQRGHRFFCLFVCAVVVAHVCVACDYCVAVVVLFSSVGYFFSPYLISLFSLLLFVCFFFVFSLYIPCTHST